MAENNPFFSVVIPTYNRSHTLHIPIQSMLNQTFSDWELIIVDDGSTDDTERTLQKWMDPRILYVKQDNQERSVARNTGISLSKGQYICFQDSDDEYLPQHLQMLHDAIIEQPGYLMYRTGMVYVRNGVQIKKTDFKASRYRSYPYDCLPLWTFHREVIKTHQFDPLLKNGEDLEFILRVCLDKSPFVIKEWTGIYHYYPITSGGVGPNFLINMQNRIQAIEKILQAPNKNIQPYLIRQRCLCSLIIMVGQIKQCSPVSLSHITNCYGVFMKFPIEFIRLLFRIAFVKFGEISGFYKTEYRF
jgi:glycosyltransferase involved in cell wall biosynthesis